MSVYKKINKQFASYKDYHNYSDDNLHWLKALHLNTEEFYKYYLETFPNGLFCQQAKDRFIALQSKRLIDEQKNKVRADSQQWENSVRINNEHGYLKYISRFSQGIYIAEAEKRLDTLKNKRFLKEKDEKSWYEARNVNTEQSYQNYLNQFPNGKFRQGAQQRLEILKANPVRNKKANETRKKKAKSGFLGSLQDFSFYGMCGSLAILFVLIMFKDILGITENSLRTSLLIRIIIISPFIFMSLFTFTEFLRTKNIVALFFTMPMLGLIYLAFNKW